MKAKKKATAIKVKTGFNPYAYWQKSNRFERLFIVAVIVVTPILGIEIFEAVTGRFALVSEASRFAQELRDVRAFAMQNNTFVEVEALPESEGKQSYYSITYAKIGSEDKQYHLPSQLSIAGSVKFDPQGVPKVPSSFTIRHGLTALNIKIDSRGGISAP